MDIQISIQAVLERKEMAEKLRDSIKAQGLDAEISYDTKRIGSWWNLMNILKKTNSHEHHIVLQDDVEVSDNFVENVKRISKVMTNQFVTLYANRMEIDKGWEEKKDFVKLSSFLCGQGIMFPSRKMPHYLEWCANKKFPLKEITKDFWKHDDVRLKFYLKENNETLFGTIPCLIEHIGCGQSVIGNHGRIPNKARIYFKDFNLKEWKQ